jgi:hypothetical protein
LEQIFDESSFYGRLIKGDYIECVLSNPKNALKVALLLKSLVKSLDIAKYETNKKIRNFKEYGVKIAVGIGKLSEFDRDKEIIDGEAIYLSGRKINEMRASNKRNDNALFFVSNNEQYHDIFEPVFNLLDFHFTRLTRAQSEIIYYKLLGKSENEIAITVKKSQSAVNQFSTAAGWWVIDSAVTAFEKIIK